jgi:hypothetical protein
MLRARRVMLQMRCLRLRARRFVPGVVFLAFTAAAEAQSVVDLPGIRASAGAAGCTDPAPAGSVSLSYSCLTGYLAPTPTPAVMPPDTDIAKRPPNTLGLYNASALQNRMGQNLGRSVQPYRPHPTYPKIP